MTNRLACCFLALTLLLLSGTAEAASPVLTTDGLEGGNLGDWTVRDDGVIEFRMVPDTGSRVWRWFYFRVEQPGSGDLHFEIPGASRSAASRGWSFGRPALSRDNGLTWERTGEASYRNGSYQFTVETDGRPFLLALVAPYPWARMTEWIETHSGHPRIAESRTLTYSLDGRPVPYLIVSEPGGENAEPRPIVWIISRQHPAETPASWKMEGLLEWLLSDDPEAAALLNQVEFHIAPFMNPDGVVRGYYRFNTARLDLNRQWHTDDNDEAPTVRAVKELMREQEKAGREFLCFVDLHSISSLRKNFFFYTEDLLLREEYDAAMYRFMATLAELNPLFSDQRSVGTIPGESGIAKDWAHSEFLIPAYTHESTYQDIDYGPYAGLYHGPDDYESLGRDLGRAIARVYSPGTSGGTVETSQQDAREVEALLPIGE